MMLRLGVLLGLALSVLFLPFWATMIFIVGALLYFENYYEAIGISLFSDLVYGFKDPKLGGIYFFSFLFSIILYILIQFLKRKLRFYPTRQKF